MLQVYLLAQCTLDQLSIEKKVGKPWTIELQKRTGNRAEEIVSRATTSSLSNFTLS